MNNGKGKKIRLFSDLNAWKHGHVLVLAIYKITGKFPKEEIFCLTSQIRKCAVSVTSNIAEGFSRQTYKDKVYFYSISLGSLTELQNQILIARDLGYISNHELPGLYDQTIVVHKLLNGLIKSSKNHNS